MNQEEILRLIRKYNEGKCSPEEIDLLETWYVNQGQLFQHEVTENKMERDLEDIVRNLPGVRRKVVLWPRIAAAASILIGLSVGGYFLWHKQQPREMVNLYKNDIAPGSNKAILTLANGQKISLTDAKSGNIAQQAGMQIKKTTSGNLIYIDNKQAENKSVEVAYNTITTPRGGQSTLIELGDGTKVMLNAASSITYPVPFKGKERLVKMTGEVFFAAHYNAAQPFRVSAKGQVTEDLGTQFNISAYDDEPGVKTTLVEGSIKVTKDSHSAIIKPGQQAILNTNDKITVVAADMDEALAWKNGYFIFNDEDLPGIMRNISRWYNVDVTYDMSTTVAGSLNFGSIVSRSKNISAVLDAMERTGKVHFKVEGRKITVMN